MIRAPRRWVSDHNGRGHWNTTASGDPSLAFWALNRAFRTPIRAFRTLNCSDSGQQLLDHVSSDVG